jgi:hypothetical protein
MPVTFNGIQATEEVEIANGGINKVRNLTRAPVSFRNPDMKMAARQGPMQYYQLLETSWIEVYVNNRPNRP